MPEVISASTGWQDIAARKTELRASLIKNYWTIENLNNGLAEYSPLQVLQESGLLTKEELDLTDPTKMDAVGTLALIASGSLTAERLVTAVCKRAAGAHSLVNCITEVNFAQAIQRAKELDAHFRMCGKAVGPLHGLPFTVKDHIDVEGHDSSAGIASYCFDPAKSNSHLVQILVDAGAVVIAKTNVPQTCLASDSINVVFGRTLNAHRSTFGAGGSSGGEGAALAMGGSLFGLGSDGAGSARMPAMANGIIGYKPSGYRLPLDGRAMCDPGMLGITQMGPVMTFGFMGHSVRDIRMVSKVVSDSKPWENDPFLYPSPWLSVTAPARPRIGIWVPDVPENVCHLFPPVLRGYLAAQKQLRDAGYELIQFTPPDMTEVWNLCKAFVHVQGIKKTSREIAKEPMMDIVKKTGIVGSKWSQGLKLEGVHELNQKLALLNVRMREAWNASGSPIDALLWVTSVNPALPFDEWTDTTHTVIFNAVDWPAISLPLDIQCDKDIDHPCADFKPFSAEDARLHALYNKESFHGLPLSVQLVGQRFQDEKLLAIAEIIHPIISRPQL